MSKLSITPLIQTPPDKYSNNKKKVQKADFAKYTSASSAGALIGYCTKLSQIDGPDIVSGMNGSNKLVMCKTKVPDYAGRYRNALIGAFIGIGLVGLYNMLKQQKTSSKN